MAKSAHFKVDPKLAELLGETYRSTEEATKELVDNSYDADAENVTITLPEELSALPSIIIEDDGAGMKESEVRNEYLNIANSRTSRKGGFTYSKNRKVKGRKGIGKFSGLMVAEQMKLETFAGGRKTTILIDKEDLKNANADLEKVPLPITSEDCDPDKHGTIITLEGLNQNLRFPNPARMKELLIRDYGREKDFTIKINNKNIGVLDLQGEHYSAVLGLPYNEEATLNFTITDRPIKNAGVALRVENKMIGRPVNFLADDEVIPKKLQNRIYGEIICDALKDDLTADYGAVIENSKRYQALASLAEEHLKVAAEYLFTMEMERTKALYQRKIDKELDKLPEKKKPIAKKAIHQVLAKFYGEPEDKINTIISVMVSAFGKL